jgi:WD40 repeat protein/serine/threonine protein kinase
MTGPGAGPLIAPKWFDSEATMSGIPSADWSWIDTAAQWFERAWKQGPRPRIEDFLAKVAAPQRPALFRELLRIELELRWRAGEEPAAEEYRRRFSEHEALIAAVFEAGSASPTLTSQDAPGAATRTGSSSPAPASSLPPELATHDDYVIVRELGHGGMGVVYLAHNRLMARDEVLKVIGQHIVEQPGVLDRFLREIRAVARLRHPNIVSAYTAFRCGPSLVFAMEYVEGLDLAKIVKAKGPLPVANACSYVHQAALGLQHAHEEGMVHRDIKPGNLMLSYKKERAVIKVLDFGLAKASSEQPLLELRPGQSLLPGDMVGSLTCTGEMIGTPDFIAPEQIVASQAADIRADIYSLGCTLYYLLSGRPPFPGLPFQEVLKAHRSIAAPLLNVVRPEVPAALAALVARMMAKEPSRRFQEPGEVAGALSSYFKKPSVRPDTPDFGVSPDAASTTPEPTQTARASAVAPNLPPTASTGLETTRRELSWSDLIEIDRTENDHPAGVSTTERPGRLHPDWLWPAVAGAAGLTVILIGIALLVIRAPVQPADRVPQPVDRAGNGADIVKADEPVTKVTPKAGGRPKPSSVRDEPPRDGAPTSNVARTPKPGDPPVVAPPPATTPPAPAVRPRPDTAIAAAELLEMTHFDLPDRVIQARLLPDGHHILYETGGRDRALWLGEFGDRPTARRLTGSVRDWSHLAFSSDGRFAVLARDDQTLWRWDLETGQPPRRLRPPERAGLTALAVSADDRRVVYGCGGTIQFCDATTGDKAPVNRKLREQTGAAIGRVAFGADGRRVVTAHADRAIRAWDLRSGLAASLGTHWGDVTDLAVFKDGLHVLTSCSDGTIGDWDLRKRQKLRETTVWINPYVDEKPRDSALGTNGVIAAAVSPDGRRALLGSGNLLLLWDLETDEEWKRVEHRGAVRYVTIAPDGRSAVSSTDAGMWVWELPPGRPPREEPPLVETAQFLDPEAGSGFPIPGPLHLKAGVPEFIDHEVRSAYRTGAAVVSRDGQRILAESGSGINLWDRATGQFIRRFEGRPGMCAFTADGQRVLAPNSNHAIQLWDPESGARIREFRGHHSLMGWALSPDGKWVYTASEEGREFAIRVWDLDSGQQLGRLEGHQGYICSLSVSPDGRRLLSGGNDSTPILWDPTSRGEIRRFRGHTNKAWQVAFLPDGHRAVSAGHDNTIRLWDVETGRELAVFSGHTSVVGSITVSPDGRRLFSSQWGRQELWIWDIATSKLVHKLNWRSGMPTRDSFTPDGRYLVCGRDRAVRLYRMTDSDGMGRTTTRPGAGRANSSRGGHVR